MLSQLYSFLTTILCFYRFNRNWIKDERYHTEQGVKDDMNLTKEEKDILLGIHRRHKTFTEDPSDTDYKFLADCYQKSNHISLTY